MNADFQDRLIALSFALILAGFGSVLAYLVLTMPPSPDRSDPHLPGEPQSMVAYPT